MCNIQDNVVCVCVTLKAFMSWTAPSSSTCCEFCFLEFVPCHNPLGNDHAFVSRLYFVYLRFSSIVGFFELESMLVLH